jgi:hypothetical protein
VTKTIIGVVILKRVCIHFAAKEVQITANYSGHTAVENHLKLTRKKEEGA